MNAPLNADQLATTLTSGGAGWMVLSVAAVLPILWSFTLILHFARPYIIRFLRRLTLRFGGDVWWLSYVLFRDGLQGICAINRLRDGKTVGAQRSTQEPADGSLVIRDQNLHFFPLSPPLSGPHPHSKQPVE